MDINKEKEYIYQMMMNITEERRKLTDIYFQLKESLDELKKLELRGLEDLSIKGYVELHNSKKVANAINNINRETNYTVEKLEKSLVPEEKTIIPKMEVEKAKEKDRLSTKSHRVPMEKVTGLIAVVLKENGTPMDIKSIHKELNKRLEPEGQNVSIQNFRNNILPRTVLRNPKIVNAMRGFYQYM